MKINIIQIFITRTRIFNMEKNCLLCIRNQYVSQIIFIILAYLIIKVYIFDGFVADMQIVQNILS